nr:MAG TPA: hypothetical protein [Caudoviricetes sp.]
MIKAKFDLQRTTKGTYVYTETGGTDAIRTLYIRKTAMPKQVKKIMLRLRRTRNNGDIV